MSLASDILGLTRKSNTVEIPELGRAVTVTALTAGDFEFAMADTVDGKVRNMHPRVFCRAVIEDGKRAFGDDDLDAISRLPAGVVYRVSQAALAISGIAGAEGN